jgi:hypothetical protein
MSLLCGGCVEIEDLNNGKFFVVLRLSLEGARRRRFRLQGILYSE